MSELDPFLCMQKAVDIVNTSPHPTNKIAASLFGRDDDGKPFCVSHTNYWPAAIVERLGIETRIGGGSGTIHAETACILSAPFINTKGSSLCVTDPFCPNCAKNIAEAGIKTIYIDHKGFDKDFAARRGEHFSTMSMQICEKAGIAVYEIRRKERALTPILEIPAGYTPPEDKPVELMSLKDTAAWRGFLKAQRDRHGDGKYAVALAENRAGGIVGMTALTHPVVGYTLRADAGEIGHPQGKYSFMLEPVNRILMNAPRHGLRLLEGYLFSSLIPTAREQVNMAGAGVSHITIGDITRARDDNAKEAMETMASAGVIIFAPAP